MSDEVTTTVATPTPEPTSKGKPPAGSRELADHYAKQAARAVIKDAEAAQVGMEKARAEGETPDDGVTNANEPRERGKDGKFKPKAAKDAKQAAEKPKDDAPAADAGEAAEASGGEAVASADAGNLSGGLRRAQKLVHDGNIGEALKLIGLTPDKLQGRHWKALEKREATIAEGIRQAQAKEQHLANIARELHQRYSRYEEAEKAYQAEDYDAAHKLAWGETPDEYYKKRTYALHNKAKDPEVIALRKTIEEERAERKREREELARAKAEHEKAQARATYRNTLAEELGTLDDGRFSLVAKKPAFINRVFDIQEQHWNERTQETIDTVEAAELAWEELYEGVAGEPSASTAQSVGKPSLGAKSQGKPAAKASTTLNPHEASEASPALKLKPGSPELREFYARKAMLAAVGDTLEQEAG